MKLIGMLDSPYVRRVAISLQLLVPAADLQRLAAFSAAAEALPAFLAAPHGDGTCRHGD